MKLFKCQNCGQMLYFENSRCESCGSRLGYLPDAGILSAVVEDGPTWIASANPELPYRFCANWEAYACNWMVPANGSQTYCIACQHNRKIPDISDGEKHRLWQKLEVAKRRLFYSLIKLRLPMPTEAGGDSEPLAFQFLAHPEDPDHKWDEKVITGHDNGLITISLAEADDAERERARTAMGEPYRTLLGHFRHEVGHYYWDKLVRDGGMLDSFRALFGDEREDYQEALKRHYAKGPNNRSWQQGFVSSYATSHPWEDWAETWAHYLHIVDTLEMAAAFGIKVNPAVTDNPDLETDIDFDPHRVRDLSTLIEAWLPLAYAVNSLNRSMGQPDLYPFVLAPQAIEKLRYIHDLVHGFNPIHS
jgi:hypothetical protein